MSSTYCESLPDRSRQRGIKASPEQRGAWRGLVICLLASAFVSCGDEERIDRVMFRSSAGVQLTATSWQLDPNFVDGNGLPLSDHEPVGVTMHWQAL